MSIITRLENACIASCGCLTKTMDFHCHPEDCGYRVLNEAIEHIAQQDGAIANHVKVAESDAETIAELRLQIRDAHEDKENYHTSAEAEIAQLRGQIQAYESWQAECGNTTAGCCEQKRRLALMQSAIDWLMKHCVHHHGGTIFRGYLQGSIEVPAEFAAIIKGTTHVQQ